MVNPETFSREKTNRLFLRDEGECGIPGMKKEREEGWMDGWKVDFLVGPFSALPSLLDYFEEIIELGRDEEEGY